MSTTITAARPSDGATISVTLRNPEFGDTESDSRRQAWGETDGGAYFTEDLGTSDETWELTFENLDQTERSDLLNFLRQVRYRATELTIEVTGGLLPGILTSGASVGGTALTTGDGYNTGQQVLLDTWRLVGFLDQSETAWEQWRNGLNRAVPLRIRVPGGIVSGS